MDGPGFPKTADADVSRRQFLGRSVAATLGGMTAGVWGGARPAGATPAASDSLDHLKPAGAVDEAYWQLVRREFNLVDDLTYMNNGTLGPMPKSVFDANVRYLRNIMEDPRLGGTSTEDVRTKVAAFTGADADEIVLTRSTTEGVKLFCWGVDLKAGDEVLMTSHEHPGGYGPWRAREARHGLKINVVDIPAPPESVDQIVSLVERAITPKTRVLFISHIVFVTGLVAPIKALAEMAHRRGLLVSVDGAHALGMLPLDFHGFGVDHYTTAGQKWLLAGTGTGVAYFKRDVLDRVASDIWNENDDPKNGARKFDRVGQRDVPSALGIGDAIDFQQAVGTANIEARVRQLAARVRSGLKGIPGVGLGTADVAELHGGLTTFYVPGVPKATIAKVLMDREQIYIPTSRLNDHACRVSTHIYNTPDEVDRLLGVVQHIASNRSTYSTAA